METFAKLFERFLVFVYHCFDRIVIQGYLPLLTRPEHIVYFFRDVHGQYPITPQVLAKRTPEYRGWVEAYARNHKVPVLKAEKGVSKEDCVRPHLQRMERRNQHGVYCIFTSMEMGSTFHSRMPRFPTDDPNYRIIRRGPSRFLHYYFYIRDPVIGPLAMCVGTYLPFQTTYYLNGHNFIEIELRRQGVAFRKDDNAFLATADPKALQAAADKLSAATIEKRLNYWSWLLGPKFSEKDRKAVNLRRDYSINQIEYCRNFIFKRHFPIHKIFEHSCAMGLFRLAADKVAYIFGVRVTKRLRGKLYSVQCARKTRPWPSRAAHLLQEPGGPHVRKVQHLPAGGGLCQPDERSRPQQGAGKPGPLAPETRRHYGSLRRFRSAIPERARRLPAVSKDGSAGHHRQNQNRRHQDSRHPHDPADEVLLRGGTQLNGWRSTDIHQAILTTFGLSASAYTLTQLRYDLRQMKAHGLLERIGRGYRYRLTDKGIKAALMFILFHKRVCGPLANSLFHHRPDEALKPASKVEAAYHKADRAIQQVLELLAA